MISCLSRLCARQTCCSIASTVACSSSGSMRADVRRLASCSGARGRRSCPASWPRTASSGAPAARARRCARRRAGSPCRASRRPRRGRASCTCLRLEVALAREVDEASRRTDDDLDARLRAPRPAARRRGRRRRTGRGRRAGGRPSARSLATWMPSSRVGTTTSACGLPRTSSGCSSKPSSVGAMRRCSGGMPKPRVLPVPVLAWPMRSVPARASGRVSSWIGKAVMMPSAARASTVAWGGRRARRRSWARRSGRPCRRPGWRRPRGRSRAPPGWGRGSARWCCRAAWGRSGWSGPAPWVGRGAGS